MFGTLWCRMVLSGADADRILSEGGFQAVQRGMERSETFWGRLQLTICGCLQLFDALWSFLGLCHVV